MKIVIDYKGDLLIERNGKMKGQLCPYKNVKYCYCGDSCPKFSEPCRKHNPNDWTPGNTSPKGVVTLELCDGKIWTCSEDDFSDNRTK